MIQENGWCSVIHREGDRITKKFNYEHVPIKRAESEFYKKARGMKCIPQVLEEGNDYLVLPYFPKSTVDFKDLPDDKRRELLNRVAEAVYELFLAGFCHGDVFEENILYDENWNVFLIDPMSINYPSEVPFSKCFDLNAKRPTHPFHAAKLSKPCLERMIPITKCGFDPFSHVSDILSKKVIGCSGSETYNDMAGKQAYSSYDFPGIFELPGWRNTKQRFDAFVPPERQAEEFIGKTILDIGCNAGAVSLRAGFLGADQVLGIDINNDRISVGNEVAKFMGLSGGVRLVCGSVADARLLSSQGSFDSCFCLAVSGRMGNERAFLESICKLVRGTMYFESNHAPEGHEKYVSLFKELGFPHVEYKGSTTNGFPIRHSLVAKRSIR